MPSVHDETVQFRPQGDQANYGRDDEVHVIVRNPLGSFGSDETIERIASHRI
jgi:hypothetical protein